MKLLPRFSLRTTLWGMVVMAVVSLIGSQAYGGASWAVAIVVGLAMLVFTLTVHLLVFGLVQAFAGITGTVRTRDAGPAAHTGKRPA